MLPWWALQVPGFVNWITVRWSHQQQQQQQEQEQEQEQEQQQNRPKHTTTVTTPCFENKHVKFISFSIFPTNNSSLLRAWMLDLRVCDHFGVEVAYAKIGLEELAGCWHGKPLGHAGTRVNFLETYCWWKKSCTSWYVLVVYPIIYRVLYIPGGCLGFLPSTAPWVFEWKFVCSVLRNPWCFCDICMVCVCANMYTHMDVYTGSKHRL